MVEGSFPFNPGEPQIIMCFLREKDGREKDTRSAAIYLYNGPFNRLLQANAVEAALDQVLRDFVRSDESGLTLDIITSFQSGHRDVHFY